MQQVSRTAEIVKSKFLSAATRQDYRKALAMARKLRGDDELHVIDALREAAARLDVQPMTGMPRVQPRGEIQVRGKSVTVEVLS